MLPRALKFLAVALTAGMLGFTGLRGTVDAVTQVVFVVALTLFVVSLVAGRRIRPVRAPARRPKDAIQLDPDHRRESPNEG
jgi:uncharacterized membrane protein YtjA (UPF0391 family)